MLLTEHCSSVVLRGGSGLLCANGCCTLAIMHCALRGNRRVASICGTLFFMSHRSCMIGAYCRSANGTPCAPFAGGAIPDRLLSAKQQKALLIRARPPVRFLCGGGTLGRRRRARARCGLHGGAMREARLQALLDRRIVLPALAETRQLEFHL